MPNTVRFFDSTMSGAPALSGTAGALIGVLDACLVDGFGSVTVDSLVVASNVATATVSAGHQFAMIGNTGPVIRFAGSSPSGLNGDWRVTITSPTEFTFVTSGIGDQTATGTITAKRAPAGFSKAFSDTNKAAYRSDDVSGTRLYCRIDDTGTTNARIRGYEAMDDVDTVTSGYGVFPTDAQLSGGGYVYKSSTASSAPRDWTLFSDGRMVYFFCDAASNSSWSGGLLFGEGNAYLVADPFNSLLICSVSANGTYQLFDFSTPNGGWLARAYHGVGEAITSYRYSHAKTQSIGYNAQAFPSVTNNALDLWPVDFWDVNVNARGLLPGLWNPVNNSSIPHGFVVASTSPWLPNRTVITQRVGSSNYTVVLDITGPWR